MRGAQASQKEHGYFLLDSFHVYVAGSGRSAIYDLRSGDVIGLDVANDKILALTERGITCGEIPSRTGLAPDYVKRFLKHLASKGFGTFLSSVVYVEKARIGRPIPPRTMHPLRPTIRRLFLELGNECDLDCGFCSRPTLYSCLMCSRGAESSAEEGDLGRLLNRLSGIETDLLVVRGGDPLTERERLSWISAKWNQRKLTRIAVITNGERIDASAAEWLKTLGVELWIPVRAHTGMLLSGRDPRSISSLLSSAGVLVRFMKIRVEGESDAKDTGEGNQGRPVHVASPWVTSRNVWPAKELVQAPKAVARITLPLFSHNQALHPCLHSTLAVSATGHLLPCPALEDESLGTTESPRVVDQAFETRLIDRYWRMPLAGIRPCGSCALRFACMDCRGVEYQLHGDLHRTQLCPSPQLVKPMPTLHDDNPCSVQPGPRNAR